MECGATGNMLLDLIGRADRVALSGLLQDARRLDFGNCQRLQNAGEPIDSCYFPTRGILTLVSTIDDVIAVNTLTVGFDGAVHASLGTDLASASHDVVSRLPGQAWQVDAARWQAALDSSRAARQVAASFTDFELQRAQRALACEMQHDVESRFCRALLDLHRWQRGGPLAITHQELSQLLGVRRTTITLIAGPLQEAGIISYHRGIVEIIDPYALRQASCACHDIRHAWTDLCATLPVARAG